MRSALEGALTASGQVHEVELAVDLLARAVVLLHHRDREHGVAAARDRVHLGLGRGARLVCVWGDVVVMGG